MTAIEIYALIGIVIGAAILYWAGYKCGLNDGLAAGIVEGNDIERAKNTKTIKSLESCLNLSRADNERLAQHSKKLADNQKLTPDNHQTLLTIAEKLKLAADTFRAVNSKTQAVQALALRNKALDMAAQLEPAAQGNAA